jgi:plasmid stability protein
MAKGIAIRIDEDLLRDVHVRAAARETSTQQYVTELIERDLFPERFPELTENQKARLRDAAEAVNQAAGEVADVLRDSSEQAPGNMVMSL